MENDKFCFIDCKYLKKKEIGFYCLKYQIFLVSWVHKDLNSKTVFSFYKCKKSV